ncbi:MAG: Smr/MutS family protein [Brevinematales bacterium]|nr:Smr/MutS family protein [Brevinematales bacterium]
MGNKIDKKADAESIFIEYMKSNPPIPKDKQIPRGKKGISGSSRSIDLHGMNTDSALSAAETFINTVRASGEKKASIITGRGSHSPGIRSPLRDTIGDYLRNNAASLRIDIIEREGSFEIWIKN